MKHDIKGNHLYKRIHVRVIIGRKSYRHEFVAPAGQFYNHSNIEDAREKMIEYLDQRFPLIDFRMADLAPNAFNFIAVGNRKKVESSDNTTSEMRT